MVMEKEAEGAVSTLENLELPAKVSWLRDAEGTEGVCCHWREWQGEDMLKFKWSLSSEEKAVITELAGDVYS